MFPSLLRGTFGNLESTHDNSLGCLEVSAGASRQTSTYELGPRLDLRESLDLARPLPSWLGDSCQRFQNTFQKTHSN